MTATLLDHLAAPFANTIATVGMFDGVHRGHQTLIKQLIEEGRRSDLTPVILTFDTHPRIVLNKDVATLRLLQTDEERFFRLANMGIEHIIVIPFSLAFASLSAYDFLAMLREKIQLKSLLMGYDNHFGNQKNNQPEQLQRDAHSLGIGFHKSSFCVYEQGVEVSSTAIRKALMAGNIPLANAMLGYAYGFDGEVVHGFKLGQQLGFPTANLSIAPYKQLPCNGIYATKVRINTHSEKIFNGMLNLGMRPSLNRNHFSAEVHLIDFSGDLYGETLHITPLHKLRDEQTFASLADLTQQIEKDKQETLRLLA